ncbi:MAG TPA: hypothetical protein EYQ27_20730, partial [Gemmatimonadetes bacterium]|nr:hypothetical protein [Gemmatimonadota bacterium]
MLASLGVVLATFGGSLAALVVTWSLLLSLAAMPERTLMRVLVFVAVALAVGQQSLADHMVAHSRGMLSQSRVVSVATLISGVLMPVVAVM